MSSTESAGARPSDALRDLYERRAELQYPEPQELPDPRLDLKWGRTLAVLAECLPCESFLDAGCGDGRFLAALPRLGPVPSRIVGTDISERILETARATVAAHGVEAELARANLEALPFEDASFDLILSSQVIEHLLDPAAGARELARVLQPGGTLVLSTMNDRMLVTKVLDLPRSTFVRLFRLEGRRWPVEFPEISFTVETLGSLLEESGLTVERIETFRFSLMPPLNRPGVTRLLNAFESRARPHWVGDILLAVATRPEAHRDSVDGRGLP